MITMKTALSALALTAIAGTAMAGDFATLDVNADGQVDFKEYSVQAAAEGKTMTLAAQEFTRMSQGDAIVTEDEMLMAVAFADQPYTLQNDAFVTEPMPYEPVETVTPVETFVDVPQSVEVIEPPVAEEPVIEDAPAPEVPAEIMTDEELAHVDAPTESLTQMPLETESEVAGEIETYEADGLEELETPLEEGSSDLPEPELEEVTPDIEDGEIY